MLRSSALTAVMALLAAAAATAPAHAARAASMLRVSAQEDVLGLSSRLVFSTSTGAATAPRAVRLTNTGSVPVEVTRLRIDGPNPGQFLLAAGQPRSFTIATHRS